MQERRAKTIAFVAARGGTGTTTVAINVAVALAHYSRAKTALLDLNVGRTIADQLLDLPAASGATVGELLPTLAELNGAPAPAEVLAQAQVNHPSGLRVIAASRDVEPLSLGPEPAVQLLGGLAAANDIVICDLPSTFDDCTFAVLAAVDRVLIVATPEVPTLKRTKTLRQRLREARGDGAAPRVVLNRANESDGLPLQQIEEFLGDPAWSVLPAAPAEARKFHDQRVIQVLDLKGPLGKALYLTALKLHPMRGLVNPKTR